MTESVRTELSALEMIRPPVNRAMRVLDRSLFSKQITLAAVAVSDARNIADIRKRLNHDVLKFNRLQSVQNTPARSGEVRKVLLLRPDIKKDEPSTWGPRVSELLNSSPNQLTKYDLELNYDYWNYDDILESILPEDLSREAPHGFNLVGHVAHLNLRDEYLEFKHVIAEIILDKNPRVRTVINKIEQVGSDNPYRTFNYEVLAGPHDMDVEVSEGNCIFNFDYSKVYWNSKLQTEHLRLIEMFKPGEAVADVMAGVGPFAVPAGKRRCFVWANDLNPDSFDCLAKAIHRNKVDKYVRPFNMDGNAFIKSATKGLLKSEHCVDVTQKPTVRGKAPLPRKVVHQPKIFSHFVMNLPATAIDFLSAFKGTYAGHKSVFTNQYTTVLPLIHVYCFAETGNGDQAAHDEVCKRISQSLGHVIRPGCHKNQDEATVYDVRDVAPLKHMFCATFKLPADVAFAGE